MIGVHVRTPKVLAPFFEHFFDPTPYAGSGLAIPDFTFENLPKGKPIYWNGDYSRFDEWIDPLIKKHEEGHYIAILRPMGDNEETRKLLRYGVFRLIPDRRFFPEVRNVELVILTG
jgi:hypothetical protein